MRFIILLFTLCVGLVCSVPVDRESDRDVEYVDDMNSRREPEVRDMEDSYGGNPQRRFPDMLFDGPAFRPIEDEDESFGSDDDDFYNYPPRPSYHSNAYYRYLQEQLRRFNQIMRMFNFGGPNFPRPQMPPGFFGDFGNFSDLPPNYDNSTYTTKNINGTIVAINETIRKVENNESSFVFHVKTVQVRPENETAGADDGITVVEAGEEVEPANEGGPNSASSTPEAEPANEEGQNSASSTPDAPVEEISETSSSSPDEVTTESAGSVSSTPESTSVDPASNDVNLARRFRRHALAQ